MIEPRIVVEEAPDADLRETIARPLKAYNVGKIGPLVQEPLALLLKDPENGEIVGGVWAVSTFGWLAIDLLFVPERWRARGIGTALMKKTEEIAVKRGCFAIRLETSSFQAPGFYEKLGYSAYGKLEGYPDGYTHFYYVKSLKKDWQ